MTSKHTLLPQLVGGLVVLAFAAAAYFSFLHILPGRHGVRRERVTMAQLDALAEPYIQQAKSGIPGAVRELCSHRTALFWDMGKDKFKKTHRTRDRIDAAIGHRVAEPLQKAAAIYACAADEDAAIQLVHGAAVESLQSTLYASAGLAVEAALVKSTMQSLGTLVCRFAPKLASSWGLCGTCALADGPLPIGDIIGVVLAIGGTLWCSHDLYRAYKMLPQALTTAMEESIDATIAQCRLEAASQL